MDDETVLKRRSAARPFMFYQSCQESIELCRQKMLSSCAVATSLLSADKVSLQLFPLERMLLNTPFTQCLLPFISSKG